MAMCPTRKIIVEFIAVFLIGALAVQLLAMVMFFINKAFIFKPARISS